MYKSASCTACSVYFHYLHFYFIIKIDYERHANFYCTDTDSYTFDPSLNYRYTETNPTALGKFYVITARNLAILASVC